MSDFDTSMLASLRRIEELQAEIRSAYDGGALVRIVDDRAGWLSGQVAFTEMPESQLRALASETRLIRGASFAGLNAEAAAAELWRRHNDKTPDAI